jgi:hypothetical protein
VNDVIPPPPQFADSDDVVEVKDEPVEFKDEEEDEFEQFAPRRYKATVPRI